MNNYKDFCVYDFNDYTEEIKSNSYAYAAYMAKQGEAMEKGEGDKYKNYNVLGVGVIDVKAEIIMGEHIYSEYFIKKICS